MGSQEERKHLPTHHQHQQIIYSIVICVLFTNTINRYYCLIFQIYNIDTQRKEEKEKEKDTQTDLQLLHIRQHKHVILNIVWRQKLDYVIKKYCKKKKLCRVIFITEQYLYPLEKTHHAVQMTYSLILEGKDSYCMNNFHPVLTSTVNIHLCCLIQHL